MMMMMTMMTMMMALHAGGTRAQLGPISRATSGPWVGNEWVKLCFTMAPAPDGDEAWRAPDSDRDTTPAAALLSRAGRAQSFVHFFSLAPLAPF